MVLTSFDPNDELDSQEQADAYISWCAENFMRLSQGQRRTYRTALRCAHWLLIVATAQLHLDDAVEANREALLDQLARYQKLGRALERQRERMPTENLIVLRSSLDCWEPVGTWASSLLTAAKCAVAALLLIEVHPLIDLWELECPDVWSLLADGGAALGIIDVDDLEFADFAVRPSESVIARFTWQRLNNFTRHMGMPPMSPN